MLTFDSAVPDSIASRDVKTGTYAFTVESGSAVGISFHVEAPAETIKYGTPSSSYPVSVSLSGVATIDAGQMALVTLPTGKISVSSAGAFRAHLQHIAARGFSSSTL